jgi:hypothetical protein
MANLSQATLNTTRECALPVGKTHDWRRKLDERIRRGILAIAGGHPGAPLTWMSAGAFRPMGSKRGFYQQRPS